MKKIFTLLILIILSYRFVFSIDTNAVKYAPLAIGNKWVFHAYAIFPVPWSTKVAARITKDSVISGKKYYYCTGVEYLTGWIRLDSSNGNLYQRDYLSYCFHPYELLIDSLASRFHDTAYQCNNESSFIRILFDSTNVNVGGILYKTKFFGYGAVIGGVSRKYSWTLGFAGAVMGDPYSIFYDLTGCVINGLVYGDTAVVGLQNISTEIPQYFSLSQNYPNPFNPSTTIEFDIAKTESILLSLYDAAGRLVEVLANELVSPGRYRVSWNGENYSSGVYFYTLKTESFQQTKRMVLVK